MSPATLLLAACLLQEPPELPPLPDLSSVSLDVWRRRILPAPSERAYEAIPWIPAFGDGLARADREEKPLLFWAMNGHPLGCT